MGLAYYISWSGAAISGALALGTFIQARRAISRWGLAAGLFLLAFEAICVARLISATNHTTIAFWETSRLISSSLLPSAWLCFSLTYARGNASHFLRKWRLPLIASVAIPVSLAVSCYDQLFLPVSPALTTPQAIFPLSVGGLGLELCILVSTVFILMNLERTYRAAIGTLRWRIKFLLLGVAVIFVARLYTSSQILLYRAIDLRIETINSVALTIAGLLILRSFFRTGYFNTEVYPSEYVIQNSFAVILAGVYLAVIGIFAKTVTYFGGDDRFALETFIVMAAVVVLAVLLQSDRLRLLLRRIVVQHFQRPLYDYRSIWKRFADGTAAHTTEEQLCATSVRLVANVAQALSVSLWLINDNRDRCVQTASTLSPVASAVSPELSSSETLSLVQSFYQKSGATDLEARKEPWAKAIREKHTSTFAHGGHRVGIPIIAHTEMLGILVVGDRVGGAPFKPQDLEMLACLRDHIAASLLNIQLARRVSRAKELEAFQTMAAFFVHDLKNAASTLNLMLENLPIHFADAAFRDDALRGVSKSATHINHLISRLGSLRHELALRPTATQVNSIIEQAVADLKAGRNIEFVSSLGNIPECMIDREQVSKVITNLLLNAADASPAGSSVRVASETNSDGIVISVEDDGAGMSREFIERSLFRPFQTTKKSGLGIGVFQSKMIIEAHHGRISVESELGKGSRFRVYLPISKSTVAGGTAA